MTYYSKYLKYKNKYLELKNMIGGNFRGNEADLDTLWSQRSQNGKVFDVTYPLFENYSQYCWISGPTYGLGFFLYLSKQGLTQLPENPLIINNIDKYTLWHINKRNIGPIELYTHEEELLYTTTVELTATDGTVLPIGTKFDWSNKHNGYLYKTSDNRTFRAELILSFLGSMEELRNLWQARLKVNKVFPVTYENLIKHYSQYCWISGPKYGLGFFLYLKHIDIDRIEKYKKLRIKRREEAGNVNPHAKISNIPEMYVDGKVEFEHTYHEYDLWFISKKNIGPIIPFDHTEELKYKTTIKLIATDGTELNPGTAFDWSHKDNGYLYRTDDNKTFKAALIL